eukprot:GHRR01003871.1.p1 GENE.GHRR01003871.1~~GHRR01003871.1.p1  ORF type:complete len:195 (+),score=36.16 GHRR01003871.1:971-1555(+)
MYPALPEANNRPPRMSYAYGNSSTDGITPSYPPPTSQLTSQSSLDNSPWSQDTNSTLRVKIADEYKLAPPVQMPPALASSTRPSQDFDYDYERQVMSQDASTSFDAFLSRREEAYYENTKASRFINAGFSPATVNLALAYTASVRGDESQVMEFCKNFKTLTEDMSFSTIMAAGVLTKSQNDLAAAANLITEVT